MEVNDGRMYGSFGEVISEIEERYCGKSILDLDVLSLKYADQAHQYLEFGLSISEISVNPEIGCSKVVTLREWIFGMLCSCANLSDYEDEIDSLFVKRMSGMSEDNISRHKEWDVYVQTGQEITSAIKLSSVMQYDIDKIIGRDWSLLLEYHVETSIGDMFDLSMFGIKWESDVVKLIERIAKDFQKKESTSLFFNLQSLIMNTLMQLTKYKKVEKVKEMYTNVFYFGISKLLKEMAIGMVGEKDSVDIGKEIELFFKEQDYHPNIYSQLSAYEYAQESMNYIKRVVRNGDLERYGVSSEEPFHMGMLLNAYLPKRIQRSDYQFVLYMVVNHALNAYNKTPRNHLETGNIEVAKENMFIAYMLSKRFKFEGKEFHNAAITFNIVFSLVEEMNRMTCMHLNEAVDGVVVQKRTYNKLSRLVAEYSEEITKIKCELDNERLARNGIVQEEKAKISKVVYRELKQGFQEDMDRQKKYIKELEGQVKECEGKLSDVVSKNDGASKIDVINVKNVTDLNVVVIGDYNLKIELLASVFSSVRKIDGNNSANLNVDSVLSGATLVAFQYSYSQHESEKFIREASKRGIPIVYFSKVNEKKILDEIYGQLYKM